jgi:hypothetical protein
MRTISKQEEMRTAPSVFCVSCNKIGGAAAPFMDEIFVDGIFTGSYIHKQCEAAWLKANPNAKFNPPQNRSRLKIKP